MIVPTNKLLPDSDAGENTPPARATLSRQPRAFGAFVLLVALPARAGWVGDAIDLMGTRVSVELWADDDARGRELVAEVMREYQRVDDAMSTYKPDSEISRVNAHAAEGADGHQRRAVRPRRALARAVGRERRRVRHHLRQRRLSRTTSVRANGRRTSRSRSASAPSTIATSCSIEQRAHDLLQDGRRAHQLGRHREGLRRRARRRDAAGARRASTRC